MARPTDRNRSRKDAEAKFPIKVDIAVAYGPWPYAEMLAWCQANVAANGLSSTRLLGQEAPRRPAVSPSTSRAAGEGRALLQDDVSQRRSRSHGGLEKDHNQSISTLLRKFRNGGSSRSQQARGGPTLTDKLAAGRSAAASPAEIVGDRQASRRAAHLDKIAPPPAQVIPKDRRRPHAPAGR